MPTFPIQPKDIQNGTMILSGKEARHLIRVLRVQKGEKIKLSDGAGKIFEGVVEEIEPQKLLIKKIVELPPPPAPFPIHLFLSLLKSEKMEYIVQKSVELNIETIHFVVTERSVFKEIPDAKWKRLLRIAEEAQKQCGRSLPINLVPAASAEELMAKLSKVMTHLLFMESGKRESVRSLLKIHPIQTPYGLWIGPEGGFSPAESDFATRNNFLTATLGPLVLRAETAAVHAISTILSLAF